MIMLAVDDAGQILFDTGRELRYYDPRNQTLETVFSTSSWEPGDFSGFFSPVFCKDSLVHTYDHQSQYFISKLRENDTLVGVRAACYRGREKPQHGT